jgi:hypothetical protein
VVAGRGADPPPFPRAHRGAAAARDIRRSGGLRRPGDLPRGERISPGLVTSHRAGQRRGSSAAHAVGAAGRPGRRSCLGRERRRGGRPAGRRPAHAAPHLEPVVHLVHPGPRTIRAISAPGTPLAEVRAGILRPRGRRTAAIVRAPGAQDRRGAGPPAAPRRVARPRRVRRDHGGSEADHRVPRRGAARNGPARPCPAGRRCAGCPSRRFRPETTGGRGPPGPRRPDPGPAGRRGSDPAGSGGSLRPARRPGPRRRPPRQRPDRGQPARPVRLG